MDMQKEFVPIRVRKPSGEIIESISARCLQPFEVEDYFKKVRTALPNSDPEKPFEATIEQAKTIERLNAEFIALATDLPIDQIEEIKIPAILGALVEAILTLAGYTPKAMEDAQRFLRGTGSPENP